MERNPPEPHRPPNPVKPVNGDKLPAASDVVREAKRRVRSFCVRALFAGVAKRAGSPERKIPFYPSATPPVPSPPPGGGSHFRPVATTSAARASSTSGGTRSSSPRAIVRKPRNPCR